jgi:hypothetical protein
VKARRQNQKISKKKAMQTSVLPEHGDPTEGEDPIIQVDTLLPCCELMLFQPFTRSGFGHVKVRH